MNLIMILLEQSKISFINEKGHSKIEIFLISINLFLGIALFEKKYSCAFISNAPNPNGSVSPRIAHARPRRTISFPREGFHSR